MRSAHQHSQDTVAIFAATSGHSGVDRLMKNLIPALAARGIQVDLLHVNHHGPYLQNIPTNVRIVELGSSHVYSSLPPLIRYLRREKPGVLLSDKDRVNRISLTAKKLARISTKVCVRTGTTVTENLATRGLAERGLHLLSMRYLYRWAHVIIVPSRGAAEDLAKFARLPARRIAVLPSPVITPELYKLASEPIDHPWFVDNPIPVVLGVGELCARKDFYTLICAFAKVRQTHNCRLVILGKGRHRQALEKLAQELHISEDVHMPGFVQNPFAYMVRASVYVHSALIEGSPVALMEALALGIPVVSTDCPSGPREILAGGHFGMLIPLKDADAMAQAIRATLDRPTPAALLREAARPYEIENSTSAYLQAMGLDI